MGVVYKKKGVPNICSISTHKSWIHIKIKKIIAHMEFRNDKKTSLFGLYFGKKVKNRKSSQYEFLIHIWGPTYQKISQIGQVDLPKGEKT